MSSPTKSQVTRQVHDQAERQGSISRLQDWLEGYLKQLNLGPGKLAGLLATLDGLLRAITTPWCTEGLDQDSLEGG